MSIKGSIKALKSPSEYPIRTKFPAVMGGHWIKVKNGFKWCTGSTFPSVGGDWDRTVILPKG